MTPRQLEDLCVPCPMCGTFSSTTFGARDWLARHRPYDFDADNEHAEELAQLIETAKSSVVGRIWNRVRRVTSRIEHDDGDDDGESDDEDPEDPRQQPTTVTRERIDGDGDDPWTCDRRECEGEVPLTWNQLIEGHERLSGDDLAWLASYTRGKDMIRLGLFRGEVAFATALGTFAVKRHPPMESAYGAIREGAAPLFIASAQLAKRVGAIDPEVMLAQMAGDEACRPAKDPDADSLNLPIYYEKPPVKVELPLPLDLAVIATELERDGATPLRGFGVLRLLDVDWISVQGKLLYLDFDEALRETLVAEMRGERW